MLIGLGVRDVVLIETLDLSVGPGLTALTGETGVLLTSPGIRPYVRSIVERFRGQTVVMSQNEIHPRARLKTVGTV